jgi:DNA-binding MarR family transcriptional regulator
MRKINHSVKLIIELTKTQAILARRLDAALGGLGLNEFTILYSLSAAEGEKLRRIDLANKIGLTASGVTRLLLPMEKIGLVKSGENEGDARARYIMLASGGRRKLNQAIERMELLMNEMLRNDKKEKLQEVTEFVTELGVRTFLS